jgi:hypothetical protein
MIDVILYYNNYITFASKSGFKYYHNPKHSGPYTAGRQGGGEIAPLEKTIFMIFRMLLIILRIFGTFFGI